MMELLLERINEHMRGYNSKSYWKMRNALFDTKLSKVKRYCFLYRVRRMEAKNCASFGTRVNGGAKFASIPILPHAMSGIYISPYASFGTNVTILPQAIIGVKNSFDLSSPIIGDNVYIGAGAKILGGIVVGNNVTIGANAVVTKDVPDDCIVVGNPAVIRRKA